MKTIFLLLLAVLAFSPRGILNTDQQGCGQGCTTIIKVLDCNGDPVANAQVTIKLCCNQETHTVTTDPEGKASFQYCVADICERTIRMNLPSTKSTEYAMENCSGGKNSECTVKVCSAPTVLSDGTKERF
jgi:hypothetical protein